MKYTRALRLMEHPLTQGILGERICARDVIRALGEHPVLTEPVWEDTSDGEVVDSGEHVTHLGRNGLYSSEEHPLSVEHEDDYLRLVLTAEVLRMFERTREPDEHTYSYNLKHTAEEFFEEHLVSSPTSPTGKSSGRQRRSASRSRSRCRGSGA